MIHRGERDDVNVHRLAAQFGTGQTRGQPTAVDQNESLFRTKTTQVDLNASVTTVGDVFVDLTALYRGDLLLQVCGCGDTELYDVFGAVGIDRVRSDFFSSRNVRTGNDDPLRFGGGR